MEQGLAAQMAGPQGQQMPTVEEVAQLLMQGVDPQKLVEMGVPPELIMEAISMIEQQMGAQGQAQPAMTPQGQDMTMGAEAPGLAQSMMG